VAGKELTEMGGLEWNRRVCSLVGMIGGGNLLAESCSVRKIRYVTVLYTVDTIR